MRPFCRSRRLWGPCVLALCAVAGAAFGMSGLGHLVEVPPLADAAVFISDEETLRPASLAVSFEASTITLLMHKPATELIPPFDPNQLLGSDPVIDAEGRFAFAADTAPVVEFILKGQENNAQPVLFEACLDLAGAELFAEQLGHRLRLPTRVRELVTVQLLTHYPDETTTLQLQLTDLPPETGWQGDGQSLNIQPLFFRLRTQACEPQILSLLEEVGFTKIAAQKPDGYAVLVAVD